MAGPTVFISYSKESPEHANRVLVFANRLLRDGIDVILDQYEPSPPEGWPAWMDKHIRDSDFVLMVCTSVYLHRVMRVEERGQGLGVKWEGNLIYQHLYRADSNNARFVPVLFDGCNVEDIPTPLQGATHYYIDTQEGYDELCRRITNQPRVIKPAIGRLREFPSLDLDLDHQEEVAIFAQQPPDSPRFFKGPEHVWLVIVAGRMNELTTIRARVDAYGEECVHWRPYLPDFDQRIGPYVQSVVGSEGFYSDFIKVTSDLMAGIDLAEANCNGVVIVVDPWTTRLEPYYQAMIDYDKRSSLNCALLIPWNPRDAETELNRDRLKLLLQATFRTKLVMKDPNSFKEEIKSPEDLRDALGEVLIELRKRIVDSTEVVRKVIGAPIIAKPEITGPGGS